MDIIEFYKGILESTGLVIGDKHGVYLEPLPEDLTPYHVNDKHLVLPTPEILRDPNWNAQIAFHPLSENVARKDSPVLKELTKLTNLSLNINIGLLMSSLISYCANKDLHKTLNHKQTVFLSLFPDADEKAVEAWNKVDNKLNGVNTYVKIVTLRDKKLDNQPYSRVAFVKFPIYDELIQLANGTKTDNALFGVKLRKKDIKGIKALFEFLLSGLDNIDGKYSFGTRSAIAPTFHALMSATHRVFTELQRTARLLRIEFAELKWGDALADLSKYKGLIPPLDGNEGDVTEGEKRKTAMTPQQPVPVANPVLQPVQQPMQAPVYQQPAQPQRPVYAPPASPNQVLRPVQQTQVIQPAKQPTLPASPYAQPTRQASQPQQVTQQPVQQPVSDLTALPAEGSSTLVEVNGKKALKFNSTPITPFGMAGAVGQPMYQQPRMDANGNLVDPFGRSLVSPVAAVTQQMYQQQMYRQPVYGQPMYQQPMQQQFVNTWQPQQPVQQPMQFATPNPLFVQQQPAFGGWR